MVDYRLQNYFQRVRLFHRTGESCWLRLLRLLRDQEEGPGSRAAGRFLGKLEGNLKVDSS